jgi:hypothetical protein
LAELRRADLREEKPAALMWECHFVGVMLREGARRTCIMEGTRERRERALIPKSEEGVAEVLKATCMQVVLARYLSGSF